MWMFQKDFPPCPPPSICFHVRDLNISFLRKQTLPTGAWPHLHGWVGGSLQLHVTKSHGDRWKERNYIEKAMLAPQNFYVYFSLNGRIRNNPMKCFYHFILVSFMKAWTLEKHLNSPHDLWILSGWSSYSFQLWHWVPKFHRVMTPFEFQRCEVEIDISLHLFWVNVLKCHVFPVIDI